jgi:hypothetical protein
VLTCERTAAILHELATGHLEVRAEEIEECIALRLAMEADPAELALVDWLEKSTQRFVDRTATAPDTQAEMEEFRARADTDLKNDWYRLTTGKETLRHREADLVAARVVLGHLRDPRVMELAARMRAQARKLAPEARYVACEALGIEVYALTRRGARVLGALAPRLPRYHQAPVKTFLAQFDKVDLKMKAFAQEVAALRANVHGVRHAEQMVIGLAKSGLRARDALGAYQAARDQAQVAADVAVTCARHTTTFGHPATVALRLKAAEAALQRTGLPPTQRLFGSAKCLLPYEPVESGIPRYVAIRKLLDATFGESDLNCKHTARLMPARGEPNDVVDRAQMARLALGHRPPMVGDRDDVIAAAVAIAALVSKADGIGATVNRFLEIAQLLVADGLARGTASSLALECIACPGTPAEVIGTVRSLAGHVGTGPSDDPAAKLAVAVAFAKRFAF